MARHTASVLAFALLILVGCASATSNRWHLRDADPTGNTVHKVAVGASAVVVIGGDNLLMSSQDGGISWTHFPTGEVAPSHFEGGRADVLRYSPGLDMFYVCGVDSYFNVWAIYSHGNATVWQPTPVPPPFCHGRMRWLNNTWTIVSGSGKTHYSKDGFNWNTYNITWPEECLAVNYTCNPVTHAYFSTYLRAWVVVYDLVEHHTVIVERHHSMVAASKDGITWTSLTLFENLVPAPYAALPAYYYDLVSIIAWPVQLNQSEAIATYNLFNKSYEFANPPELEVDNIVVVAEWNDTMFWIDCINQGVVNGQQRFLVRIINTTDGINWFISGNVSASTQWYDVDYSSINNTFLAVGDLGTILIGTRAYGNYYFNDYTTYQYVADFKQVLWIDATNEFITGPGLMTSKTAHKWELLTSEIEVPIAQWHYIAQSTFAQFFAIGAEDHYILTSINPKRWTAIYVPEIRSHKPVMASVCSNGGPSPGSVLVTGYYTHHEDAMSVRSLDGGQTWTNLVYFQPGAPIRHCTYGNGVYVGLTFHPHIYTSANGSEWHKVGVLDKDTEYMALRFLNNRFVAVGNNCTITSSLDGVTWTNQTIPDCESALNGFSWNAQVGWMFVGEDGTFYTSPDLVTFNRVETAVYGSLRAVAYSEALSNWVIVGPNGLIMSQIIEN